MLLSAAISKAGISQQIDSVQIRIAKISMVGNIFLDTGENKLKPGVHIDGHWLIGWHLIYDFPYKKRWINKSEVQRFWFGGYSVDEVLTLRLAYSVPFVSCVFK